MNLRRRIVGIAPPWLQRHWGSRLLHTFGALFDGAVDWSLQGLRARMPSRAHPSALAALGRDRRIVRGYQETDEAYRARLLLWLDSWRIAGNPVAILEQVQGYFGPQKPTVRTVSNRGTWFTLDGDGVVTIHRRQGNWDWDGDVDLWGRFWLIVEPDSVSPPLFGWEGEWEDDPEADEWGGDLAWGLETPSEVIDSVRDIVRTWKPANTRCEWIVVAPAGDFDPEAAPGAPMPDGTWAHWGTGDPRTEARWPDARFCQGTGEG